MGERGISAVSWGCRETRWRWIKKTLYARRANARLCRFSPTTPITRAAARVSRDGALDFTWSRDIYIYTSRDMVAHVHPTVRTRFSPLPTPNPFSPRILPLIPRWTRSCVIRRVPQRCITERRGNRGVTLDPLTNHGTLRRLRVPRTQRDYSPSPTPTLDGNSVSPYGVYDKKRDATAPRWNSAPPSPFWSTI